MSFNHYLESVDNVYRRYSRGSARKQFDNVYKAIGEIESITEAIESEASQDSSLETKQEAIITLLKVSRRVVGGESELGSELRKSFGFHTIEIFIEDVVGELRPEEVEAISTDGRLAEQLGFSQECAKDYGIDLGLAGTIKKLAPRDSTAQEGSSYATPIDVDLL